MPTSNTAHVGAGASPGGAAPSSDAATRAYRRAWWSVALYPLSFAAALAVGEGLLSAVTDGSGHDPAFWQVLVAGTPALLVFVVPGVLAVSQGREARRLGRKDGNVPALVGAAVGSGFVALNAASYLLGLVVG